MLVDLVQTMTRDGVRLDGSFQAAPDGTPAVALDAVCLVHGAGGNFYGSALLDALAGHLLRLGCAVLRANTRGHDVVSNVTTARGGRRLGAAFETVDDCRHDLAAWCGWLAQRAGARIGLMGHSLGAVKCVYAMAHEPQIGARCVVAVSPPRLSYAHFCSAPEGPQFLEDYARAERHVEAGQPGALLEVRLPLPTVVAAGAYVEKYGPAERYDYLPLLRGFPCPVLVTLGGKEVADNMAFRGAPEALAAVRDRRRRPDVEVFPEADHFYTADRDELLRRLEAWLRRPLDPSEPAG